ncbi:MAG: transposase [Spirochaetaceae bacterium]|jgi:hypothetical protein|nr:transposase [Spirochaetaceae bacterium]
MNEYLGDVMAGGESFNMAKEFADVDFNGARLEKRFVRTMKTLPGQPDKSIRASSENRAEAKSIYNMAGNEKFDRNEILGAASGKDNQTDGR